MKEKINKRYCSPQATVTEVVNDCSALLATSALLNSLVETTGHGNAGFYTGSEIESSGNYWEQ
jgi:hypothetical protein